MRVALVVALSGCIVGANFTLKKNKDDGLSLPILIGAGVADFTVVALASSQLESFSLGASIATGLAATAADLAVGCILGACKDFISN